MTCVVGLTGGIGSGKSTVAAMLAELGATVIDADAIVRELQAPGTPLLAEIALEFGEEILDAGGALDRARLAALVFGDTAARLRLEALVHPPVRAEMARRVAEARAAGAPLVALEIPLLFESRDAGTAADSLPLDATLVVWVPEDVQVSRSMARNDWSRTQATQRVRAQLPLDEKRELSDHVIDNSGTLDDTRTQVRELYGLLSGAAAAP